MSHRLSLLLILLTMGLAHFAKADGLDDAYNAGLKFYQSGQYDQACEQFQTALRQQPANKYVLYNSGLCELQRGKTGLAMALWRRALYYDPGFGRAGEAIDFYQDKLKVKALPHQITNWETLRSYVLVRLTLMMLLGVTALSLLSFGWFLIQFFIQRRNAVLTQSHIATPSLVLILSGLVFFTSVSLLALKYIDDLQPRAIIIADKIEVRSGPGAQQSSLFELFEGLEVIINESLTLENQERWAQVTYPGGSSGWLPVDQLFVTAGKTPW